MELLPYIIGASTHTRIRRIRRFWARIRHVLSVFTEGFQFVFDRRSKTHRQQFSSNLGDDFIKIKL